MAVMRSTHYTLYTSTYTLYTLLLEVEVTNPVSSDKTKLKPGMTAHRTNTESTFHQPTSQHHGSTDPVSTQAEYKAKKISASDSAVRPPAADWCQDRSQDRPVMNVPVDVPLDLVAMWLWHRFISSVLDLELGTLCAEVVLCGSAVREEHSGRDQGRGYED